MALRHIISGVTFANAIGKALPDIPGLLSLGFFGTTGDGINTNRAPSGPPYATIGNAPIVSTNYLTVGRLGVGATGTANAPVGGQITGYVVTNGGSLYTQPPAVITLIGGGGSGATAVGVVSGGQLTAINPGAPGSGYTTAPTLQISGGNYTALDTSVTRSSVLTGGWSCVAVARVASSGLASNITADQVSGTSTGTIFQLQMRNLDGGHASSPTISLWQSSEKAFMILPTPATNWRMLAYTYTGGATGTAILYNLSENPAPVSTGSLAAVSAAAFQQLHLGPHTASNEGGTNTADIAFSCVAAGVLSASFLQTQLAPAVKSILLQRGITVI